MEIHPPGGIIQRPHTETVSEDHNLIKRLHVRDRHSGIIFLLDTGLPLLSETNKSDKRPMGFNLYAANDTCISTYGEQFITLNLDLRRGRPLCDYRSRLN